jgi:hypothetical protein
LAGSFFTGFFLGITGYEQAAQKGSIDNNCFHTDGLTKKMPKKM